MLLPIQVNWIKRSCRATKDKYFWEKEQDYRMEGDRSSLNLVFEGMSRDSGIFKLLRVMTTSFLDYQFVVFSFVLQNNKGSLSQAARHFP